MIYATLKIPEIVSGMTPEDFRKKEKEKALQFKNNLDEYVEKEDNIKDNELFMGMTDEEILVN